MLGRAAACAFALALAIPVPIALAQNLPTQSAVLTVDPERLFADSRFGKAAVARLEAAQAELLAENKKLETALEAEEKDLTERRPTLPPEEFRRLADAFNAKAEEIRAARLAKSRSLTTLRDDDRQKFLTAVVPILGDLMGEMGALVILDKKTVFLSFERIDVTDRAIARIDTLLDDNLSPRTAPAPTPPPEQAPESTP
jgi:Skp family chaperone for outer membrane proteins